MLTTIRKWGHCCPRPRSHHRMASAATQPVAPTITTTSMCSQPGGPSQASVSQSYLATLPVVNTATLSSAPASAMTSSGPQPGIPSQANVSQSVTFPRWTLVWDKRSILTGKVVIAITLIATILALWQTFGATHEANIANQLALWSA